MLRVEQIPVTREPLARDLLREAYIAAYKYSEDDSTHTGAVIANGENILVEGFNHYPPNTPPEHKLRPAKYDYIIHAEVDVITKAQEQGVETQGLTIAMPWFPCKTYCAPAIRGAGLQLLCHKQLLERSTDRWQEDLDSVIDRFQDAGVHFEAYDGRIGGVEHLFDGQIWYP